MQSNWSTDSGNKSFNSRKANRTAQSLSRRISNVNAAVKIFAKPSPTTFADIWAYLSAELKKQSDKMKALPKCKSFKDMSKQEQDDMRKLYEKAKK